MTARRACLVVILCAACGADERGAAPASAPPDDVALVHVTGSPRIVIGGSQEGEAHQLFRVTDAFRLSDGRIVIANAGTHQLRYFDEQGRHTRSIGRQGGGPGEFRSLHSASRIRGDTVVVWDPPLQRLTFLDPSGAVARVVPVGAGAIPLEIGGQRVHAMVRTLHVLEDGTMIAEPAFTTDVVARGGDGVRRDTLPLLLFDRSGAHVDQLGPVAAGETFVRGRSSMPLPFGHRLHIAAGPDVLYVGTGRSRTVDLVSRAGSVGSIALPVEDAPVTEEDVDSMKERMVTRVAPPGRAGVAEMLDAMPLPNVLPFYSALLADAEGRLWVREYRPAADGTQRWMIVERDGALAARVALEPGVQLLDAGSDYVLVRLRDQDDVEQVRLYRYDLTEAQQRREP